MWSVYTDTVVTLPSGAVTDCIGPASPTALMHRLTHTHAALGNTRINAIPSAELFQRKEQLYIKGLERSKSCVCLYDSWAHYASIGRHFCEENFGRV